MFNRVGYYTDFQPELETLRDLTCFKYSTCVRQRMIGMTWLPSVVFIKALKILLTSEVFILLSIVESVTYLSARHTLLLTTNKGICKADRFSREKVQNSTQVSR